MNHTPRTPVTRLLIVGKKYGAGVASLAALLLATSAQGAEFNQFVADKSAVSFAYRQMNVPLEGNFTRFKGRISFDPAKPALAKAEIDIDLASIDTGSEEGDDEVAGKLWFNTRQFPVARFVSSSIRPLGDNRFEVAGKMSIKGRTLDTKTLATFRQQGNIGVFEGGFVLKRGDYGIGEGMWADYGTVANEVQIKFRLTAAAAAADKK
ncbi:YceI family protein [Thiobacillus sp.]